MHSTQAPLIEGALPAHNHSNPRPRLPCMGAKAFLFFLKASISAQSFSHLFPQRRGLVFPTRHSHAGPRPRLPHMEAEAFLFSLKASSPSPDRSSTSFHGGVSSSLQPVQSCRYS